MEEGACGGVDQTELSEDEAGNDEYPDFVCHPCRSNNGHILAAKKFCVDCGYLMCNQCFDQHNKFDIMRGHQITTPEESTNYPSRDRDSVPTFRCGKHNGKVIDMLCCLHEIPGCTNCMSIGHSACEKAYIPTIAVGIKNKKGFRQKVASCGLQLDALKESQSAKEQCLAILDEAANASLQAIKEKQQELNTIIDSKHKDTEDEIMDNRHSNETALLDQIKELKATIAQLEANKTKLERLELNDSDTFIMMKMLYAFSKDEDQTDSNDQMIDALASVTICDAPNDLTVLKSLNIFGEFSNTIIAEFEDDFNIKGPNDKRVTCITESCLLDDGNILLADQNNKKIKLLNTEFQLENVLKLPGKPGAVCQTKYPEVAIAIYSNKSIQFATVTSPMTLTRSVSISESCRGIAFTNAGLYMSCGGKPKYKDGPGEIRVYDEVDDLCRKYTKVGGIQISIPKRMVATSSDVYFTDSAGYVFGLGVKGSDVEKGPYMHKDMIDPVGICSLKPGILIVCGYESHNVMLLNEKDGSMKPLLGIEDGIKHPKAVCVDSTGKKLIVAMDDVDYVKVFDLITK